MMVFVGLHHGLDFFRVIGKIGQLPSEWCTDTGKPKMIRRNTA
jgi:hypothetical protein